jgi:hypothetical protein
MKTVTEIRDAAKERTDDVAATGKKAAYAAVGAPVVAGRRVADYAGKVRKSLQKEFEIWVAEGERLSGEVSEGKVVSEIKERVDFENLQGRVEKLKDQLEEVLTNWKETFKPGEDNPEAAETEAAAETKTAKKSAAKKPAAKKATAAPKAEAEAKSEDA